MTAAPAEPLTAGDLRDFETQLERLGETLFAQMLRRTGSQRLSYLRRVDRINLLAKMRKVRK